MDADLLSVFFSTISGFTLVLSDYLLLGLLLLLIVINLFVSGAERAFFILSKSELEKLHTGTSRHTKLISHTLQNSERLLASIIIAYNVLNIAIAVLFFYLFNRAGFFSNTFFGVLIQVVCLVFFMLIFIEMMPKITATHHPMAFVRKHIRSVRILTQLLYPFSALLLRSRNIINKSVIERKNEISMDDLSRALELTSDEIKFEQEKEMLKGIIRFRDKEVDDIMVSRSSMVALDLETPFSEVIGFIVTAGFSRIPVYEESPDTIKGVLYVKDLLPHLHKPKSFRWQSLIRSAYFVPETKGLDDLLEEFRTHKNHIAIVVDEYGGTSGIVTMEDILEEIVGDISDEYDEEDAPVYTLTPEGDYLFEGQTPLDDFFNIVHIDETAFEEIAEDIDTLAGLLLELKGNFPQQAEKLTYKNHTFIPEALNKRRILKVRYIPLTQETPS